MSLIAKGGQSSNGSIAEMTGSGEVEVSLAPLPSINGNVTLALFATSRNAKNAAGPEPHRKNGLPGDCRSKANEITIPWPISCTRPGTLRRLDPEQPPNAEAANCHNIDLALVLDYRLTPHPDLSRWHS
jgi:hypothetical protein